MEKALLDPERIVRESAQIALTNLDYLMRAEREAGARMNKKFRRLTGG